MTGQSLKSIGDQLWSKDTKTAIKVYQKAIELDPSTPWVFNQLGLAYQRQENFQKAIENYKEEIKRRPKEATVSYSNCAFCLAALGKRDEAIALCKRGETLEKEDWLVPNMLGLLLQLEGAPEGAEEAYRRALKINAKQSRIYVNLARLLTTTSPTRSKRWPPLMRV